jgi:tRNA pseudouridine38-40 synthase
MPMEVKRYFIELSFNGGAYHGWQRQPNAISVQQVLEGALSKLLRENIIILGAGRTDTGVHARKMYAHFDLAKAINDPKELVFLLNGFLPNDIAIKNIHRVVLSAHARFDASDRSYEYHITTVKDPFYVAFNHYLKNIPDIYLMNQATKILLDHEDFQCFSKSNTDVKTFLCDIKSAEWRSEGSSLVFYISANRFLRNMVRAIVGTLLEIGFKKKAVEDLESIIKSRDRCQAGFSVPAKGLYLTEIQYPQNIFID